MSRILRRSGLIIGSLALLACSGACGARREQPQLPAPAPDSAPASLQQSWHELALEQRNMNAILRSPLHAAAHVAPQQPLDLTARGVSAAGELRAIPFPADSPAGARREAAAFTEEQLILDGASFDAAQARQAVSAPEGQTAASFDCGTSPAQAALSGCAYAIYRYELLNAAFEELPQSVGVLWGEEDSPSRYYIGLSNWDSGAWDWYEGTNDNVVTLATLYGHYRVDDGLLYVAVLVADSEPRSLELVQVGAVETRGLGGLPPQTPEAQDFYAPEIYYPGKAAAFAASYTLPSVFDRLGYAYDQGASLMCTCCAAAAAQNYELARNYSPLWQPLFAGRRTSPKWIYRKSGLGCLTGRTPETVMDFLKNTGGATELRAPFNTNCTEDWDAQVTEWDRAHLKVDGWWKIRSKGQEGISEIKQYLTRWERPILLLATVDESFKTGDFSGNAVWNWNDWFPNIINWHTMLIIGWDDGKDAFLVRNSWGHDWGTSGDVWIDYDTFKGGCWVDAYMLWDDHSQSVADWFAVNVEAHARPPAELGASKGLWTDNITLNWDDVPNATQYEIYRDDLDGYIALANDNTYQDFSVSDKLAHLYWVRTRIGDTTGAAGTPTLGWLRTADAPAISNTTSSSKPQIGAACTFTPHVYNPSGGGALSYSWAFPAGCINEASPITSRLAAVTFKDPGEYDCLLTVTNSGGSSNLAFHVSLTALPQMPVAHLTGPSSIKKNRICYLDGSASTCDASRSIVNYDWDYNGDGYTDDYGAQAAIGHIFPQPGAYSVRLRVRDSRGDASAWSAPLALTVTDFDEIEPNDADEGAQSQTMTKLKIYKASIGPYPGALDGGTLDWWQFPYHNGPGDYTHYVRVQYDPAKVTELTVQVWGDTFEIYVEDISTDGLAEVYFPGFDPALSTLFVKVEATGTGGCDYSVSFDRFGEL